jgi:hypothetical protein
LEGNEGKLRRNSQRGRSERNIKEMREESRRKHKHPEK